MRPQSCALLLSRACCNVHSEGVTGLSDRLVGMCTAGLEQFWAVTVSPTWPEACRM